MVFYLQFEPNTLLLGKVLGKRLNALFTLDSNFLASLLFKVFPNPFLVVKVFVFMGIAESFLEAFW